MTVKQDTHTAESGANEEEPEIVLDASASDGATDGTIPMVEAIPLPMGPIDDDPNPPPSYNPAYSNTTTTSGASSSSSPYTPVASSGASNTPVFHTSAVQQQVPPVQQQQQQQTPPGLPPGGRWVHLTKIGPATWTTCAIVSVITCFFTCFPCGVWAFLCPCDEERAYLVDGKLFDDHGRMIGSARSRRYR